jgi:GNAT superfamily N-acetyltransferase
MRELTITTLRPEHFDALEELQRTVYPTLGAQELMRAEHFAAQYQLFPEGQIVVVLDGQVVGQGSGFFIDFDFDHPDHTFREICDGFYFTHHDPNGAYYYGADISVHPDFRGRGIGRRIYDARKALVRQANRRGIVAGGLIPGYAAHQTELTPHQYVDRVIHGELKDSTLSFQLAMEFEVRGLLANYIEDSASANWATLIEWVNPDYQPLCQK